MKKLIAWWYIAATVGCFGYFISQTKKEDVWILFFVACLLTVCDVIGGWAVRTIVKK